LLCRKFTACELPEYRDTRFKLQLSEWLIESRRDPQVASAGFLFLRSVEFPDRM
jgi:hypothetical protein